MHDDVRAGGLGHPAGSILPRAIIAHRLRMDAENPLADADMGLLVYLVFGFGGCAVGVIGADEGFGAVILTRFSGTQDVYDSAERDG